MQIEPYLFFNGRAAEALGSTATRSAPRSRC